jgi:hypothetical protein
MTTQWYMRDPKIRYGWTGRCKVDRDGVSAKCFHYPHWPDEHSAVVFTMKSIHSPEQWVEDRYWVEVLVDQDMIMDEGL